MIQPEYSWNVLRKSMKAMASNELTHKTAAPRCPQIRPVISWDEGGRSMEATVENMFSASFLPSKSISLAPSVAGVYAGHPTLSFTEIDAVYGTQIAGKSRSPERGCSGESVRCEANSRHMSVGYRWCLHYGKKSFVVVAVKFFTSLR